ncbi:sulfurtransferase TusA [Saccharophagus degradans]|uniref:SirA-like protein n=1 Tax=Saccharophagus degradans (strain 2-40 / ATCC 43961 / DSM 17024) TaxID=203122 RepID=Q21LL2_SACD2|nr:sulfurtransferase TusA [Saccharophagus degradans]ABD80417.1 SirA-like protein [Saccharophagus degradans 2-40]MBU2984374.1 sulfurtransferase TusA [Saccharophagus degradans]WGO97410.1 sulfurtransferase TusA [Saccharophagus degradans]
MTANIDINDVKHHLDTKGLTCPEPVMLLHTAVRDADVGDVIRVEATDPSTQRDIPKFCQFLGHPLLASAHEDELYIYYIRKG